MIKFDHILLKTGPLSWLALFVVFILVSLSIHSYQIPLGSNEVVSTLNHRPNLLNQNISESETICPECTITFSKARGEIESGIYRNKGIQPKFFAQIGEMKIPILMQNRTGGWPFLSLRIFRDIFGPSFAIFFQSFLLSLIFLFCCFKIFKGVLEKRAILLIIPACFFPFISFFFPIWLDSQWSMVSWLAGLTLLSTNKGKTHSIFAGALIGLGIHFKLASLLFGLPWLWFVLRPGLKNLNRYFFGALFCLLFIQILIVDYSELYHEIFNQRNLVKSPWFFLYGLFLILLHLINPAMIFNQLAQRHELLSLQDGESSIQAMMRVLSESSIIGELIGLVCVTFFLRAFIKSEKKGLVYFLTILAYFISSLIIARGVTEDLTHYLGYGITLFLFFTIYLSIQRDEYNKIMLFFIIYSLSWSSQTIYTVINNKNYSPYEKLANDLKKVEGQIFTDHYESIGQIEYYSGEKLWPFHMRGKYKMGIKDGSNYPFLKGSAVLIMLEGPDIDLGMKDFRKKNRKELIAFFKDKDLLVKSWTEFDYKEYRRKFLLLEFL